MEKLFLIIDGYNVLHSCGMLGRHVGPGTLERARNALAGYLKRHLSPEQRRRTTIVFDSRESDLPTIATDAEILIEFASDHASADDRIIQLIRQHSAPRQLLVVSSDHQIQRAALSRRASVIDSEPWMEQLRNDGFARTAPETRVPDEKRSEQVIDVDYWMRQLGLDEESGAFRPDSPAAEKGDGRFEAAPSDDSGIFPPGYGDELFEDDDQEMP